MIVVIVIGGSTENRNPDSLCACHGSGRKIKIPHLLCDLHLLFAFRLLKAGIQCFH